MLIGGPGAGISIGNISTHISNFPCDKRIKCHHINSITAFQTSYIDIMLKIPKINAVHALCM